MGNALLCSLLLAAPLRLVGQLESQQEVGTFPVLIATEEDELPPSQPLFRWILLPSVEALAETRRQDFSVAYRPRLLLQDSIGNQSVQNVTNPLILHSGVANHVWRAARGVILQSNASLQSGEVDAARFASGGEGDDPVGGLPDGEIPAIGLTQFSASTALQVETGDTESMTLGFRGSYFAPWDDVEETLLGSYELGVSFQYAHYLFKDVDGVFDVGMAHTQFIDLDVSSRQVSARFGARWRPRSTLRLDLRAGALVIVGDGAFSSEEGETPEAVREILPSALFTLDWTFLATSQTIGTFISTTSVDAVLAGGNASTYIPQVATSAGVRVTWPAATLIAVARAATSLGDLATLGDAFLPTYYQGQARLDVPASRHFGFYVEARGGQRAPPLGNSDFEFAFDELVGMVGVRLWYSTGRDPGLDRPTRQLEDEDEGG